MTINKSINSLWSRIQTVDWKLLVFLLLFLNVKLVVKIAAILLIYVLRANFKFGFRLKNSRLPLFYILMIAIAIFNWLISGMILNFTYGLALSTGIIFWILCILAIHQIKLSVEENEPAVIHRTILIFFIINAVVSLAVYTGIILETGHINPYRYQGNFQKYFIGTGDYIKGITLDTSTTNAVINAFGVIYFLKRKKYLMVLLCMLILLLTGSNITNLLLLGTLLFIFISGSTKNQKSMIIVCLLMCIIFWVKISPQNSTYLNTEWKKLINEYPPQNSTALQLINDTEKPDSLLTDVERKRKIAQSYLDSMNTIIAENEKIKSDTKADALPIVKIIEKPLIPKDSIHTPKFQHKNDTTVVEKNLITFIAKHPAEVPLSAAKKTRFTLPGKIISLRQTLHYFKQHPLKILTGVGIGNFSSKLAFRTTSMKITGDYPARFTYINSAFQSNHLDLYLYYFTNKDDFHSITNSPNSTYDQLLSEYGLTGLLSFAVLYIGFFVKRIKKGTYVIPLLLLILGAFFIEYWFEQLSIVIFFELLALINTKEPTFKNIHEND